MPDSQMTVADAIEILMNAEDDKLDEFIWDNKNMTHREAMCHLMRNFRQMLPSSPP